MESKSKGEQARERLIECAAKLFLERGYNATGINDILAAAAMTKGSFYFYFTSKKELAVKVFEYYQEKTKQWVLVIASGKSWEDFISVFVGEKIDAAAAGEYYGCPMAVLGGEIAFQEPDIAARYSESMKGLISIFAKVLLQSGVAPDQARILAKRAFIIYEGYILYYRISKDGNELKALLEELKGIIPGKKANQ